MIAGSGPGWASHWESIGKLAMEANRQSERDPQVVRIAELMKQVSDLNVTIDRMKSREASLEEYLSKANARVDDQAAVIVDLQAKLGLGAGDVGAQAERETIKKLAAIEDRIRGEAERNEARVRQLEDWARAHGMNTPDEPAYYKKPEGVL